MAQYKYVIVNAGAGGFGYLFFSNDMIKKIKLLNVPYLKKSQN